MIVSHSQVGWDNIVIGYKSRSLINKKYVSWVRGHSMDSSKVKNMGSLKINDLDFWNLCLQTSYC